MKLPDKFKFKHFKSNRLYTATKSGDGYLVTWKDGSMTYHRSSVESSVRERVWIIQTEKTNGVDAEGNPLNFTVEDLKPFMRVVLRNNNRYIICPSHNGKEVHLVSCGNAGHNDAYFDANAVGKSTTDFEIVEVYAQPQYWEMLDVYEGGPLLWKATPKEENKEQGKDPFKERIEYFETNLKALSDELAALKAEAN